MTFSVRITGAAETQANLERLRQQSPARARRAVNRAIGVVRQRVIKAISLRSGIARAVIGGRRSRTTGAGVKVKGRGYVKQVRASRQRSQGALVVLTSGVRFSRLKRTRLGGLRRRPGGVGTPFRASMPSGLRSMFERIPPQNRVSRRSSEKTKRANLPIREIVIPIEPHASRAAMAFMRRAATTVYPQKVWEELNKAIKPVR